MHQTVSSTCEINRRSYAGVAKGEFKPVNPLILSYTLFSALRWLYYLYKPGKKITAEMLEAEELVILLEGVRN